MLRWHDANGPRQRTIDIDAKPSNRRKAYKLAAELEAELTGDLPPNILLSKTERRERDSTMPDPLMALKGDWEAYKQHFIETHLSGLSPSYSDTMLPILGRFERFANPQNIRDVTASKARLWIAQLRKEKLAPNSIKTYWRHLSAFLSLAVDDEIIDRVPKVRLPKSPTKMKGNAFYGEQLDRILSAVEKKRSPDHHVQWKWSINALWFSGLRISEAYRITWNPSEFWIDMKGKHPCYMILGDQKNKEHIRLPIVPDFVEMLQQVPKRKRNGNVFSFPGRTGPLSFGGVKKAIRKLGSEAGIKTAGKKTATAHDFRRSFGSRWALKVMPQVLQKLMRHANISTTMTFYAHLDADMIIDSIMSAENTTILSSPTGVGDQTGDQTA